jgi:hypothetical protein
MKKTCHLMLLLLMLPTFVFGQTIDNPNSLDSQFATPTNLTDKQMNEAKDFIHQGQKDRIIKEKCAAANDCQDKGEGFPIETLIGKAYTVLGMFSGSGMMPEITMKVKPDKAAQGANLPGQEEAAAAPAAGAETAGAEKAGAAKDANTKKEKDYCMLIATAYETVGTLLQQQMQKKAENTTVDGDEQLQALVSLQETHKAREKTAKIQSYVYGGVTACYGAKLATGAVANPSFILKMGGAAALTGLFMKKAKKHKSAADKVGEVIAALDWAGKNCNPWTKSACFCSEPTSKERYPDQYQEVCVLNKGNFETPKIALGCTAVQEGKVAYDKECKCKQNNSCMKANLKAFNPKFGMGTNLMAGANKTFEMIGTGDIDQGELDRATLAQTALATKIKSKDDSKIKAPALTDDQKKMAEELKQYMPANAAALMASAQPTMDKPSLQDSTIGISSVSALSEKVKEKLGTAVNVSYKKGGGYTDTSDDSFELPKMPGMGNDPKEGTEVLTFAEKAVSKADVNNTPSTPIFDIISNRYRRSGWSKLDTEGK